MEDIINIELKESFGEEEGEAYFKILKDDEVWVEKRGKSIKKLKKEAYKDLLGLL